MNHALLIGIGYLNTDNALLGPLRDVYKIRDTLVGYECTIITDLTDEKPTKKIILDAFRTLLKQSGSLFFYYSGHGVQTPEAILTLDSENITHEEFHDILETMDKESTLFAVVDTCFSGDLFDLAYHWRDGWKNNGKSETPGHVFLLSSSQKNQVSLEVRTRKEADGMFTLAYLDTIREPQTWVTLLENISSSLSFQRPELSTGQKEDENEGIPITTKNVPEA
jgi:hypothetical protein